MVAYDAVLEIGILEFVTVFSLFCAIWRVY